MDSKIYDMWLKINVEIHNRLEELKGLDNERKSLIKEAEDKGFNEEIKERMNINIKKYDSLLEKTRELNLKAQELKNKLN